MASLKKILRALGRFIEEQRRFRLYECFIDGTFFKAKGGGDGIGCTKAGKGVKIIILVDAKGVARGREHLLGLAPRKQAHPRTLRLHAHQRTPCASHW